MSLNYVAVGLRVRVRTWEEGERRAKSWLSDLRLLRINGEEEKWRDSRVFTFGASLRQASGVFTSSLNSYLWFSVFKFNGISFYNAYASLLQRYFLWSVTILVHLGLYGVFQGLIDTECTRCVFWEIPIETFLESHTLIN